MFVERRQDNRFIQEFEHRFSKFCERAPLFLSFTVEGGGVTIESPLCLEGDLPSKPSNYKMRMDFKFNFSVEENILIIRDWLKHNWYPRLIEEKETEFPLTVEQINEIVEQEKIPLHEAVLRKRKIEKRVHWIITKLNLKKDEILVENQDTLRVAVYKMKIPTIMFVKRIRERQIDPLQGWTELSRHGELLYYVEPKSNRREE